MPRAKECVNRTELILTAAQELFGRYGFERTTIDDIARQAGIGKGSVYLEYKNKDEILLGVIRCFVNRKEIRMKAHLEQAKAPYLEALKKMLQDGIMSSYDVATAHMHTPEVLVHTSRKIKTEFKDHFVFCHSLISEFLEKAAAVGELNQTENVGRYAELIMLSCTGLLPPYLQYSVPGEHLIPTRQSIEQNSRDLLALLIDGLKKRDSA